MLYAAIDIHKHVFQDAFVKLSRNTPVSRRRKRRRQFFRCRFNPKVAGSNPARAHSSSEKSIAVWLEPFMRPR
jgi:hypothetical protein